MPTDTPSPHRFLAPSSKQKLPSGLRHVLAPQTPKSATATFQSPSTQPRRTTPAKRFVIPPPRVTPTAQLPIKDKEKAHEIWKDPPAQDPPRPTPRRKFERVESIQDSSQSSPVRTQEEQPTEPVIRSIEHDDEEDEMLFAPVHEHKRRRISPPSSPTTCTATAPHTPLPTYPPTSHRFKLVPPRHPGPFTTIAATLASTTTNISTSTTTSTTPALHHRPHFLLPPQPTSPPQPSNPLPEIFSPSRKTGKYIPDGLASTMTSWIVEAANSGFAAQHHRGGTGSVVWGHEREDGIRLRVRVARVADGTRCGAGVEDVECFAGGVAFVRGEVEHGRRDGAGAGGVVGGDEGEGEGEVRLLLVGQGGARGSAGVTVSRGGVVGVRAPMWNVESGRETWTVGVDWVVL